MSILPSFANMVDYSSMKHSIVPRMTALCIETRATSVSHTLFIHLCHETLDITQLFIFVFILLSASNPPVLQDNVLS